jgi:hypothetical protein
MVQNPVPLPEKIDEYLEINEMPPETLIIWERAGKDMVCQRFHILKNEVLSQEPQS